MIDRFGTLPDEVQHLLETMIIKLDCFAANVEKIDAGPRGVVIAFRGNRFDNPAGLVELISQERGRAKLRPDQKVVFTRDWPEPEERMQGVRALAAVLATLAKKPQSAARASRATVSKT